jgi:aldehyde dehydrogenase (NAD+)
MIENMIENMTKEVIESKIQRLRKSMKNIPRLDYKYRISQLKVLKRMVKENTDSIKNALWQDLNKPPAETALMELGLLVREIDYTLKRLKKWMRARRIAPHYTLMPASCKVVRDPLGLALIFAPWNYPFLLSMTPLVGAIAGGNRIVLKPNNRAKQTCLLVKSLLEKYLDPELIQVVCGDRAVNKHLLEHRFDHFFLTGGPNMARVVMGKAAEHISSVTLELGGKSPVYIDETVDIKKAAKRIAWGKFINVGQTCIAPDYVLVKSSVRGEFVGAMIGAIKAMFPHPWRSKDYARLIDGRNFDRVTCMIDSQSILYGGQSIREERFMEPTLLLNPPPDSPVMSEEIFGPILPIIDIEDENSAIEYIKRLEKPLAMYVFSNDKGVKRKFLEKTSSGSLNFNLPLGHLMSLRLPFGGIGESGIGKYHGKRSFDAFTVEKGVLSKPLFPDTISIIMPPYTKLKAKLIDFVSHLRGA